MFRIVIEQDERSATLAPGQFTGQPAVLVAQPAATARSPLVAAAVAGAINAGGPPSHLRGHTRTPNIGRGAAPSGRPALTPAPRATVGLARAQARDIGPAPAWLQQKAITRKLATEKDKKNAN